ncbi:hypothetical protein MTO96_034674 [Rhipicephalus appendiculatus]
MVGDTPEWIWKWPAETLSEGVPPHLLLSPVRRPHDVAPNSLQRRQLPLRVDIRASSKQLASGISTTPGRRRRHCISAVTGLSSCERRAELRFVLATETLDDAPKTAELARDR